MMSAQKSAIFAISSLGLGHATRTLAIVKFYLKNRYTITIVSEGNALAFLRRELEKENVEFLSLPDYPPLQREGKLRYLIADLFRTAKMIRKEHAFLEKLLRAREDSYEFVFSDGRYGFYSSRIPSFLLSHQISFHMPPFLSWMRRVAEYANYRYFKKFDTIFIPDFKERPKSLAGDLSHARILSRLPHHYVGYMSSYEYMNVPEDIDYLFIIAGFLKEHRHSFIEKLIEEAKKLPGKKVFVLGDTSKETVERLPEHNIEIRSFATEPLRSELFNRARVIVSRSGYTTVMDLAALGKRAVLVPTPHQTEQEYLGQYLSEKHFFITAHSENALTAELLKQAYGSTPHRHGGQTRKHIEDMVTVIHSFTHHQSFSFIVPASNEEKYIERTIESIERQVYSRDRFETIIVENGSRDKTYAMALSCAGEYTRVFQSDPPGVSRARNTGFEHTSPQSDWIIFLDSSTHLGKHFLRDLNRYLMRRREDNLAIGTTSVLPESSSLKAHLWFWFYNIGHKLTRTSFSIQIAARKAAIHAKYDEHLHFSEDLKYLRDCQKYGAFFFFDTIAVRKSTRRFERVGYLKQFLLWNYQAFIPYRNRLHKPYPQER